MKPKNINYCGTVVKIEQLIPLDNCDNVLHASIFGNLVIVSKNTEVGEIGIFFPVETQLSKEFLSENNLYRDPTLNKGDAKKGYFESNGRIRCVKFRGNKSEGFYIPINSVDEFLNLKDSLNIGDEFDELNGVQICQKYIPKSTRIPGTPHRKSGKKAAKIKSKLIDNQFRFHDETSMLYRNLHRIHPEDLISISYKLHGTSCISSKILCKKPLKWNEKILKKLGVNIVNTEYDYIYSSRKVIKNEELHPNANHYYDVDIWGLAHEQLKPFLQNGLSFYSEIIGNLPSGAAIQKDYDYGYSLDNFSNNPIQIGDKVVKGKSNKPFKSGNLINTVKGVIKHSELNIPAYTFEEDNSMVECRKCYKYKEPTPFGIYIYRITYTNNDGKVFEFSAKQVQDFCKEYGLNAVPELFYGYAKDLLKIDSDNKFYLEHWQTHFLSTLKNKYNDKDCYMCSNIVPEEGCVIRIENNSFEAYKVKSSLFYEKETKQLDKGEIDIESSN